ncbi:MAG: hypothetical protein ACI31G_03280 [Bacilli bacterium]
MESKEKETLNQLTDENLIKEDNHLNEESINELIESNEDEDVDSFDDEEKSLKEDNKTTKKKKIKKLVSLIIPVSAIISGIVVGIYFGNSFFSNKYDPNLYDQNDLEDDQTSLMKRFNSLNDKNGIGNVNYAEQFTPYELVNIGFNQYASNPYNYSISIGEVTPSGMSKQSIRNLTIKNNDSYFCESISKGIMSIAKRFVQSDEFINVYKGSSVQVNSASYSSDKVEQFTIEQFENVYGRTYARPTCYVISSKTVLSSSSEILENNYYKVSLSLDENKSVVRYVKQMKAVSDLSSYPIFKKIDISYILDESLNLVESVVDEDYIVNYVINVNTHGYLKETFYPNQQLDFLNIDEDYDYEGGTNQ